MRRHGALPFGNGPETEDRITLSMTESNSRKQLAEKTNKERKKKKVKKKER
jgi:hypothetical protein